MAVSTQTRKIFPLNISHDHFKILNDLSLNMKTMKVCKVSQKLDQLEDKLNSFDAELTYANVHSELTEKYDLTRQYYRAIEGIRKELSMSGVLSPDDDSKCKLVKRLDEVVSSLKKDFSKCVEDKYRLLDEIFIMRTNSHVTMDVDDLALRVEGIYEGPGEVYACEFTKIISIHDILEEEEGKLIELRSQIK